MKQVYLKCLLLGILALFSIHAAAYDCEVDGIYYDLDKSAKTASVTYYSTTYSNKDAYKGSVTIPSSFTYSGTTYNVTSIGYGAFENCSGLTSVTIPNSVNSIGSYAFFCCSGLTSVTIPNSVTSIGNGAFDSTTWYNNQPDGLVYAGKVAYRYKGTMPANTNIALKEGTLGIAHLAFIYCSGLTSVTIPNSVTSIGGSVFYGCSDLTSIVVSSGNSVYDSRNNCNAIIETATNTLTIGCKSTTIPNSVTSIRGSAFANCSGLTSVTIPNSVTSIENWVFHDCSDLTSVTIPNSVTSIGYGAFENCSGLTSVTIPNSVTSIENRAFYGCKCFIFCERATPPKADYDSFNENMTAIVPDNLLSTYQKATGWKNMSFNSPCFVRRTAQTSITLWTSNLLSNVKAVLNEVSYYPQADSIRITGLEPNTNYEIAVFGDYGSMHLDNVIVAKTKDVSVSIGAVNKSNLTLKLKGSYNFGDLQVSSSGFEGYEGQDEIYVQGLTPGQSYSFTYYVNAANGKKYSKTGSFQTVPVGVNVNASVGPSSAQVTGSYSILDATVTDYGFEGYPKQNQMKFTGLDPNKSYNQTFYVITKEGGKVTKQITYTTETLTLTTSQPKVISAGNVIVAAESNLDDEETNVGFEWRRTDWSSDFASNQGNAYLYNGTMEGYIRNLYTEKLWKFRPYYTSNAGNTYYGEWVGIDPTNTSYFEPTVHTYANISVNGNSAEVKGYAMRGTDNVTSQGFAYWVQSSNVKERGDEKAAPAMAQSIPSNAKIVEASGQVMTATLSGLNYGTTYCYVAFVKTSEGETFYGEQQSFSTGEDPSGIDGVVMDASDAMPVTVVARYNMNGQQISTPQPGVNILRMSDGTVRKVLVK